MKKPNLFLVGLDKAGTTALHEFLSQHPQVFMSFEKEPGYFAKDVHKESDRHYGRRKFYRFRKEKDYLELFKEAKKQKIVGESSTIYLFSKFAAKEIYKFNPKAKIIISLREPVSYIYSSYKMSYALGKENAKDFETAIKWTNERRRGKKVPPLFGCPSATVYPDKVKYFDQVKRYLEIFPKKQVKIIIYEDFRKDNKKTYKEILKFLEVNTNFSPNFETVNITQQPRFSQKINRFVFSSKVKDSTRQILPKTLRESLKSSVKKMVLKKSRPEKINPRLRDFLKKRFKPEVEKISKLIKKDLVKKWGYEKF